MGQGTIVQDRFELLGLAARGGMGAVHRARDKATGAIVALKTIHESLSESESERLVREGSMLAALAHPGIVRYVAHGVDPNAGAFVAMEWVEGITLRSRIEQGGLTIAESVDVVRRISEALGHAHRAGAIHRDIKPSNVMLRDGDVTRPVLIDFGVARPRVASDLTQTGVMLGTPHFMAPEQARGTREVDARADVFALGGLLYYCLTRRHVFSGDSLMALLAKVLLEDAPDVRQLAPDVPASLAATIARMLAKNPAERPADGRVVAGELAAIVVEDSTLARMPARPTREQEMLTGNERRLVSVIASKVVTVAAEPEDETQVVSAPPAVKAALVRTLAEMGARAELLADGTILASVSGFGGVLDQAAIAARCALRMRRELPGTAMALVTGSAVFERSDAGALATKSGHGSDVFERAAALLARGCTDAVALDDATAGLLDGRFDVGSTPELLVLRGERDVIAATRTFLGRTMACVGRERELSVLRAVWDEVVGESVARVVLVTAPAGVGKSRVRWEFLRGVEESGEPHALFFARGDAVTTCAPYALLGQALRRAAGVADGAPNPFARLRARVARSVTKDVNEVAELLGEVAQTPNLEPSPKLRAARADPALMVDRVAWAFEAFVTAECATQPVLFVFEDLHWGDGLSIELVDRALRICENAPLLVLALGRPELHTSFPTLWSERSVQPIPLGALSKKAAERLVRDALEGAEQAAIDAIVQQGGGNALYLEELVRAAKEGRGASSSLLALVQSRVEALSMEERRVLRAASVFGQTFWSGGVATLLSGSSPAALEDVLRALEKRELVARRGEGRFASTEELLFRHALVRDAAYEMLTPADAELGHRVAGEWLEEMGERDPFVLAGHFERGRAVAKALDWLLRAAERALLANAFAEVDRVVARVLALEPDAEAKGTALAIQADSARWSGDIAGAAAHAAEALALLRPGTRPWYWALRTAGHAASFGGHRGDLPQLAEMLLIDPAEPSLVSELVVAATQVASGLVVSGMRPLAFLVLDRIESFDPRSFEDNPGVAARVHHAAGLRAYDRADYERVLGAHSAMVECYSRAGDRRSALTQCVNVGFAHTMLGELEQAIEILERTEADCERLGLWAVGLTARQNLGFTRYCQGRLDQAEADEQAVVVAATTRLAPRILTLARRCLALIHLARGDWARALEEARRAIEGSPDGPVRMASLAVCADALVAGGRLEEARAAVDEAMSYLERGAGAAFVGDLTVRCAHVGVLEALGDVEGAREALKRARAVVDQRLAMMGAARRRSYVRRVPEAKRIAAAWERLME